MMGLSMLQTKLTISFFSKSNNQKVGFIQITIPPGAYEIASLNIVIIRVIIAKHQLAEANYPFIQKPKF